MANAPYQTNNPIEAGTEHSASAVSVAALEYASRGWPVLPLHTPYEGSRCSCGKPGCGHPGKHPRTLHGLKDATTDAAMIRDWWILRPNANVGIATGRSSGIVVLDVDPLKGGDESLEELQGRYGLVPNTVEVITGGGGRHVYFKHPGDGVVRSAMGLAGLPGLDVKGDGGYVVAPPSRHPSGRRYEWECLSHPDDLSLAPVPGWLLHLLDGQSHASTTTTGRPIPEGQRNATLTSLAGTMRRRGMTEGEILPALQAVNSNRCQPPLAGTEVAYIARSICRYRPGGAEDDSVVGRWEEANDKHSPGSRDSATDEPRADHKQAHGDAKLDASMAVRLVALIEGSGVVLFHDQYGDAYAAVHTSGQAIMKIGSAQFRRWIAHTAWDELGRIPSSEALRSATQVLEGQALFGGAMHHLSVRVAWHEGAIIYDLGDGRAVRISRDGWDLQHTPPVLFRRFAHQRPQVEPVPGGRLEELLEFANLLPEDRHGSVSGDRLLAITYPVVGLVPAIVHVVLAIQGEQGSGKSTKMKVYKALIDPSHVGLISPPPNLREFVQVCSHHWVCFLDNVSGFPDWLSDAICRACTGEGFSKRELYSDDQDIIYAYKRILGLNGVILAASKADLLDRCLILELERVRHFQSEQEFWARFEEARPRILGAMFTTLSQAMRIVETIEVPPQLRMVDFVRWGSAAAEALGYGSQAFLEAFEGSVERQVQEAIDASPVGQAVLHLVEACGNWEGTPTDLLERLNGTADELKLNTRSKWWPKSPSWVWRRIKEMLPNLRAKGVLAERGKEGNRTIALSKAPRDAVPAVHGVQDGSDKGAESHAQGSFLASMDTKDSILQDSAAALPRGSVEEDQDVKLDDIPF